MPRVAALVVQFYKKMHLVEIIQLSTYTSMTHWMQDYLRTQADQLTFQDNNGTKVSKSYNYA